MPPPLFPLSSLSLSFVRLPASPGTHCLFLTKEKEKEKEKEERER
jgi:hypothetical protein